MTRDITVGTRVDECDVHQHLLGHKVHSRGDEDDA
jgi:hypothetical protein